MPWSITLMWAERAVAYVDNMMKVGSSNRWHDVVHTGIRFKTQNYETIQQQLGEQIKKQREALKGGGWFYKMANVVEQTGMGNCMERAVLAFRYLETVGREKGIAYYFIKSENPPGVDHAFVVLGLDEKPPKEESFKFGTGIPNWGLSAVVCDPWYHEWFIASVDWKRVGKHILQSTSKNKLNDQTIITMTLIHYV